MVVMVVAQVKKNHQNVEPRDERGRKLAAQMKLSRKGHLWMVPSQSSSERYAVDITGDTPFCSCPTFRQTSGQSG